MGSIPGLGSSPGEGLATHSSIFPWEILWTAAHQAPLSMGHKRPGHDLETK